MDERDRIQKSAVAFDGTVVAFGNRDRRWAIVHVDEMLNGPDLPEEVEVQGWVGKGLPRSDQFTTVDRTFLLGGRYRFFFDDAAPPFRDNVCTATRHLGGGAEVVRPAPGDVGLGPGSSAPVPFPLLVLGLGLGAIGACFVVLVIVTRREDRASPSDPGA